MYSQRKQSHYPHTIKILLCGRVIKRSSRSTKDESGSTKLVYRLDKAIEDCAQHWVSCQASKDTPPVASLRPWLWPAHHWQWIHVGSSLGKTYYFIGGWCTFQLAWDKKWARQLLTRLLLNCIRCLLLKDWLLNLCLIKSHNLCKKLWSSWKIMGLNTSSVHWLSCFK